MKLAKRRKVGQHTEDFDDVPRRFEQDEKESSRLPIKLADGSLQKVDLPHNVEPSSSETEVEDAEGEVTNEPQAADNSSLPKYQWTVPEAQEEIARIAQMIIEDAEENVELLGKLREYFQSDNVIIRRLALASQLSVYKDMIPGYRIRPLTEVEKTAKVSREVRRHRNFEQTMLANYQSFVELLPKLIRTSKRNDASQEDVWIAETALSCVCGLLRAAPHFNFRTNLLECLTDLLCRKTRNSQFDKCLDALINLFVIDGSGRNSLDAVRLLCKKIRLRHYAIHGDLLASFLHLKCLNDLDIKDSHVTGEKSSKSFKRRAHSNKREKKAERERRALEAEMREAASEVSQEEQETLQAETLKLVFATYFRILKEGGEELVSDALEGLAKFSHLINVEFFGDLLEVLKEIIEQHYESSHLTKTRPLLLCIVTAFALLQGQGETLNLDLGHFIEQLYALLPALALNAAIEASRRLHQQNEQEFTSSGKDGPQMRAKASTEAEMMIKVLDTVCNKQRSPSLIRIAAFLNRSLITSLQLPDKSANAILELCVKMIRRFPSLAGMYSTDDRIGNNGVYRMDLDQMEASNPAAASAWAVFLLEKHYSPNIRACVKRLSFGPQ